MADIGDKTQLNETEQALCRAIAKKRYSNNRKSSVKNSKIGGQSNEFTDLEGIGSELAFCKLFNVYPDFSIEPRSSLAGEDTGDATLRDGRTVDVKATKYSFGRLVAVPWKQPHVDLFALMVGRFPEYEFRGFMKKDELLKDSRLGTLGHGPTYIAEQKELKNLVEV